MLEKMVHLEVEGHVAVITLNRPHVRNAISLEMVDELDMMLDQLRADDGIKTLIFTGRGDCFISGGDLEQFSAARSKEKSLPMLMKVGKLLSKLEKMNKPTIAMINGPAIGGGCEFAAACDFRMASENAKMGFVQIGMHITTGWGSGSRLVRKIGRSKALAILLTGEIMDAQRALELGFADRVFAHERLREGTLEFAQTIARHPSAVIEAYMKMVQELDSGADLEACIEMEIDRCSDLWGSDNHYATMQSFLNKSNKRK